jgi:hypothetical protein
MAETSEPVREDFLDFPTAWRLQPRVVEHHPKCSAAQTQGGMLCDCGSVVAEWERRVAEQVASRDEQPRERDGEGPT